MARRCILLTLATLACVAHGQINKDLLKAIKDNNPALVNVALKSFGKVNAVGEDGDTALLFAARLGKYKAVKALLKGKADTAAVDASGLTVMHVAAAAGEARVLQALLPAGLDANALHEADGLRPLHRAVLSGNTDAVKTLLNAEVPADQLTADGKSPLELADGLPSAQKMAVAEVLKKFARAPQGKAEL
jgi:ankyrin repeat protein